MSEIRHILYETGVNEIFRLVVEDSQFAGTYEITKPDGWDDVDSVLDIDEETFNVNNFIIGDTNKISFLQYVEDSGYDIVKKVYNEKGGDGRILFKWIASKDGVETDLLGNGFELNLNRYNESFEKSAMKIELEIKKRESQSKLLNREDISVNLFSTKDLDNLDITPVETEEIFYKEGSRKKTNFYFYDITQFFASNKRALFFPLMARSEGYEIGTNTNNQSGYLDMGFLFYRGALISTKSLLPNISIEISNLKYYATKNDNTHPKFKLFAVKKNGATVTEEIQLGTESTDYVYNGEKGSIMQITNQEFQVGNLKENESLELLFKSSDGSLIIFANLDTSLSVEVHANLSTPIRKSQVVRLNAALNQICRLYTNGSITLQSSLLNPGGFYYNSAVSTGLFMRGVYTENIMTTSLKSLLYDGIAPLLACGFDLQDDKMIVENIDYFFKDIQAYDLSDKEFLEDDYRKDSDSEIAFNQLVFGGKKYSSGRNRDILNGNTEFEAATPIKSVKRKFDKRTDFIIDEDKIQSIILDNSTSSKSTDDDLVLIDLVNTSSYQDEGVLTDCVHTEEGGNLVLYSYENPFDTFPLSVGMSLTITSGLNAGTWTILNISRQKLTLNKTTGIQTGTSETPIRYIVSNVLKNRTTEGFNIVKETEGSMKISPETMSNIRHNPKFQMARWFGFFGGGMNKKSNTEQIIVTDYKNNGNIRVVPNSDELAVEIQGETIYKNNESLGRLRMNRQPFFSGDSVSVTVSGVSFDEFLDIYNRWRYGIGNDPEQSRGFITVPTPEGNLDVYPFEKGLSHNKQYNELTVSGKVKNGSGVDIIKPILKTVTVQDSDTVFMEWEFSGDISEGEVLLQVSKDNGKSWRNLHTTNVGSSYFATITDSIFFNSVINGTELNFRVVLNASYFSNSKSNIISHVWTYNSIIYNELLRSENENCGFSVLEFEITGAGTATVVWNFESWPSGGYCRITDKDTMNLIESFESTPSSTGAAHSENKTSTFEITGAKRFRVELETSRETEGKFLSCYASGNVYFMNASLGIDISEAATGYSSSQILYAFAEMYDRNSEITER